MRQGGFDLRVRYSKAEIDAKLEALEQRTVYYGIGVPGTIGFGVAPARKEKYEAIGAVPYDGHDVDESPNRGLYLHTASGSTLCHIPKHYYKYVGNIATLSDYPQDGYVLDRSFINGGVELDGVFIFITHGSNNSGKLSARKGYAPLSTGTANNPINALSTAPANNLGGIYKAAKSCDASAFATPMWHFTMLARLAKAHGEASTSTAVCAFVDVLPKHPKGNNNNALKDYNDTSVTFTSAGNATYPNCALTGSGVPYPKTTHNGQQNGVADLNGNIWTACSGMTYRARTGATGISGTTAIALTAHGYAVGDKIAFGGTPAVGSTFDTVVYTVASVVDADNFTIDVALARDILATNGIYTGKTFYILKESVDITAMQDDSTTAGTGAFDMSLYDQVDLSDLINPSTKDQWKKLGNGTEQVFDFNTDRNTNAYKRASLGIPRLLGQSAGGTTEYGNDGIYSHLRHDCVPMAGGSWDYTSNAGPGAFYLSSYRTLSYYNVGVRASFPG